MSSNDFQETLGFPSLQATYHKYHFAVDVKLHLPRFRKSPDFAREMPQAFSTIDVYSMTFYNKI